MFFWCLLLCFVSCALVRLVYEFSIGIDYERGARNLNARYRALNNNTCNDVDHCDSFTAPLFIPVMTFNLRYDGGSPGLDNEFESRLPRLVSFLNSTRPWLLGVQEPFGHQVDQLITALPADEAFTLRAIGFDSAERQHLPASDPSRKLDFNRSILYNSKRLNLLESQVIWLSETPDIPFSKSWGSKYSKSITIARFQVTHSNQALEILAFNTHVDSFVTAARIKQVELIAEIVRDWSERHPAALVVLTGDFNSVPGQLPHRIISERSGLTDLWIQCKANRETCELDDRTGISFHGWYGITKPNSLPARILMAALFTLHGLGFTLPSGMPLTFHQFFSRTLVDFVKQSHSQLRSLWDALPGSIYRLHVDWIFTRAPLTNVSSVSVLPRLMGVGETRDHQFSSDHFPILAVLQVQFGKMKSTDGSDTANEIQN
jgi:endonuclease/exonuclease/phosphatase family metal-dependent hydrolase